LANARVRARGGSNLFAGSKSDKITRAIYNSTAFW